MAAEHELVCPIGQDARKDIAYVVPCHHQFCLSCILWWGKQKKNCPLCRRKTEVVKVAAWDDDEDLNFVIRPPAPPIPACFQEAAGLNFSSSSPSSSPSLSPLPFSDEEEDEEAFEEADEEDEEAEEDPLVGGLQPEAWAQLYRQHHQILDPVLPWLHQELRAIFDTDSCPAAAAESFIFAALCDLGPNGEELIEQMRPVLEDKTEMFIQGLMDTIMYQRREEAHRLLGLQGTHISGGRRRVLQPEAGGQPCGCPWPQSSTQATLTSRPGLFGSAWSPSREEQPSTPGADIRVGPSHAPAAHTVREAEGPHEEMEQAAAGPSAQGSSPSAPSHLPEKAQRPPKRSVDSNQDAQPPCMKPPHLLD